MNLTNRTWKEATPLKQEFPRVVLAIAFLVTGGSTAFASTIIAEDGPHDGWNILPFGGAAGAGRYQQIYTSSLFSEPVIINSVAFSTDQPARYSANVMIRFTTTSTAVEALGSDLASNFTRPLTPVFSDSSVLQIIGAGSETFGLAFEFSATPFVYDPAEGNLLMDILISRQSLTPLQFPAFTGFSFSDAHRAAATTSRAYDTLNWQGADEGGLRTEIGFSIIPEPATVFLLGLGLAGLAGSRKRPSGNL